MSFKYIAGYSFVLHQHARIMRKQLKVITDRHLEQFEDFMILKNLSKRTIRAYMSNIYQFLDWWDDTCPELPMSEDVGTQTGFAPWHRSRRNAQPCCHSAWVCPQVAR